MKNTEFDFKAAGYETSADWSRLWDLVPPLSEDTTRPQRTARAAYEKGGRTKALMLALLRAHGVNPEPYDPDAVGTRNVG